MGRQVFTAGEILTAANMNDLSDQSVMVFDDASARTTAIPTPVEGMVTYLKDTDAVEKFDGSSFVNVSPGGLVAVKSAIFTGTQVVSSVAGGANFAVTDLSITHEVADASNKLIISAFFGVAGSSLSTINVALAVHDGTGLIALGDTAGNRVRVTAGGAVQGTGVANSNSVSANVSAMFVHTPGAGSKTYTVRAINANSNANTLFVNRTFTDPDNKTQQRGVSAFVIQEVAV